MESRDHSCGDPGTHEAHRSAEAIEQVVSAEDAALAPVERDAAVSVPPRQRRAWLGWAAASTLLIGGGTHYVLAYQPLEEQRERAETARVQRLQAHEDQLSSLRSELERTRAELEQANTEAAALKSSQVEAAAAADASAVELAEPAEAPTKKNAQRRSARRARRSSDDASSAKLRASSLRKPQARVKAADSSQPLRGVLSPSNDPLEGL